MAALLLMTSLGAPLGTLASHSGPEPLVQVTGVEDCHPTIVARDAPELTSREAIVIIGEVGPTGFILGHDPATGEPIPRSGSGVTQGDGTQEDPYIIEGWLIEQATNGIRIEDTTAHVVIRENRLAHHASHAMLLANAGNVTIERNILETNVGSGVHVEEPSGAVEVRDNAMVDNQRGVSASEAGDLRITQNAIRDSRGTGIDIAGSNAVRVESNVVDGTDDDGIYTSESPNTKIRCNRVVRSPAIGIHIDEGSPDTVVEDNHVETHGFGILVSTSHRTQVVGNYVHWSTGFGESTSIFIYESHDAVVEGNELSVAQFGIVIRRSNDNQIASNQVSNHTWGVFCTGNIAGGTPQSPEGALRNVFRENTFQDHDRSITLRECDETTITGNLMIDQEFDGIHDFESVNNTHKDNTIENAGRTGILLWREGGHLVTGNKITGAQESGIKLHDTSDSELLGNELEENLFGILMRTGSANAWIEGNHLVANDNVGVYLFEGSDATVTRNGIYHNPHGIVIGNSYGGGIVQDNDIRNNTETGLNVQSATPMQAPDNWWGCAEGPGGSGCDVLDGPADVSPWRDTRVPGVARAPVIEPLPDRIVDVDETVAFSVNAHHPDRDPFTLSAEGLPSGALFDPESGDFHWSPGIADEGEYTTTFVADDQHQSSEEELRLTVMEIPDGPLFDPVDDLSIHEGQSGTFTVVTHHPEDRSVVLSAQELPLGAVFTDHGDGTGTFDWTPEFGQAGSYEIMLQASDGENVTVLPVTVDVLLVEQEPIIDPIGDRFAAADHTLEIKFEAHNPAGASVALALSSEPGLPDGASFSFTQNGDRATGLLEWTPSIADVGSYTITLTATSTTGSAQRSFELEVTEDPSNVDALVPFLENRGIPASPAIVGESLLLRASADHETRSIDTLVIQVSDETGSTTLQGTHQGGNLWHAEVPYEATQPGEATILVTATDSQGIQSQSSRMLDILPPQTPEAIAPNTQNVEGLQRVTLEGDGDHPLGRPLTYQWQLPDDTATSSKSASFTPAEIGVQEAVFTVTDPAGTSATTTTTILVHDTVELSARFVQTDPDSVGVDEQPRISLHVTDDHGETVGDADATITIRHGVTGEVLNTVETTTRDNGITLVALPTDTLLGANLPGEHEVEIDLVAPAHPDSPTGEDHALSKMLVYTVGP